MKKILSSVTIASLLVVSGVQAKNLSNKDLLKKIEVLEAQLAQIKKDTTEQIDELYDRVDQNEFEATTNRIKWGGSIEMTDNDFKGKTGSVTGMSPGRDYHSKK